MLFAGSVRIAQEISKKNRIKTALPQPGRWQATQFPADIKDLGYDFFGNTQYNLV